MADSLVVINAAYQSGQGCQGSDSARVARGFHAVRDARSGGVAAGAGEEPSAFDQAVANFAETYAEQNERDYAALQTAVKDGKAEATADI